MFKRPTIAAATVAISIMAVGAAFAQQTAPAPAQPPAGDSSAMGGMMQGRRVMPMGMMEQMSKMMENCNRMMQSNLQRPESSPSQQQPTQQPPQGNHG